MVITVDTENLQTPFFRRAYNSNAIDLEIDGQPAGATRIADICEDFGLRATFFVNVYEHSRIGERPLSDLCGKLVKRGHDVQIHTHPIWIDPQRREHMWQYSLNEQSNIIRTGMELIKQWTGRYPLAHRAGAYGLNLDTIEALRLNRIRIDSSMFLDHPNCKLVWSRNAIVEQDGVLELPVTGFYRRRYRSLGPIAVRWGKRFIKSDLDWCSLEELVWFADWAEESDLRVINFFMHSYSLIRPQKGYSSFERADAQIQKLERFLAHVSDSPSVEVITMSQFGEIYGSDPGLFMGADDVPVYPA